MTMHNRHARPVHFILHVAMSFERNQSRQALRSISEASSSICDGA